MRSESREYGLANGHSPIASKVACIDFDGTLYPFGELFSYDKPNDGAVECVRKLEQEGWKIVILTSRLSSVWLDHESESRSEQWDYIAHLLDRDGIPYHAITAEKVPAEVYIDDKAIRYEDDWDDIYRKVHRHVWVAFPDTEKGKGDGFTVCSDCADITTTEAGKIYWYYIGEHDEPQ